MFQSQMPRRTASSRRPWPRQRRGQVLLVLLLVVGLLAAGISGLVWRPPEVDSSLAWLAGGLGVAGWSALALWRRNAFAAAKLLLFCTLMPAVFCLFWSIESRTLWGPATWLGGASAVGAVLFGRYLWREWRREEVLPNVLLETSSKDDIYEIDGLQLRAGLRRTGNGPVPLELCVWVQSCVDAKRTLTLKLSGPSKTQVHYPDTVTVEVGPAEVGMLAVPLHPLPGAPAGGSLYLSPSATGPGGARLRHWHARPFTDRLPPAMEVLSLVAGTQTWGDGWSVELSAMPEAPPPPPQLPPERWTVLWRPGSEQLVQARAA